MKNKLPGRLMLCIILSFFSCKKTVESLVDHNINSPVKGEFYEYIIQKGQHYANFNSRQAVEYDELRFKVKFDSSAFYTSIDPANQEDINKLYGSSDNNAEHQQFSARFGWNWTRNSLRLYAYVYNTGKRNSEEILAIQPGREYHCSLRIAGDRYIFLVDEVKVEMHRASTTLHASGYKLYPYFGGDEIAPHDVHIWIKEL